MSEVVQFTKRGGIGHKLGMRFWPRKSTPIVETKASGTSVPEDWLLELFGASVAGSLAVSSALALTVPAVAAAVRVISEAAATLDIDVVRIADDGTETVDNTHQVAALLRGDANPWTSGFELIRDLVSQALTSDAGGLAWVNRVNGRAVEVIRYDSGRISVQYDTGGTGEPTYRLNGQALNAADVIHLRGPFSRCAVSLAADAIGVAQIMEAHAGKLFKNGAKPAGVIEFEKGLSDEGLKKMRAAWRAAHEGADNAGKTAILWDGATFRPLTLNSTDAQFLELRTFQILEIARAFRVPPHMLFEMDRATWSNTESLGREFLTYTLEPWLRALEGALRRALFTAEERATYRVRFDRDDLTRADLQTRATAINSLVASRVLNPNEGRQWLDMAPYAGGEVFANPNTGSSQPGATA